MDIKLKDFWCLIFAMVPTVILTYPWCNATYKYIEWYSDKYMED